MREFVISSNVKLKERSIVIGEKEIYIGKSAVNDIAIAREGSREWKWVRTADDITNVELKGLYFVKGAEYIAAQNIFLRGKEKLVLSKERDENAVEKSSLFFDYDDEKDIVRVGGLEKEREICAIEEFLRLARVFKLEKENMCEALWRRFKKVDKGGVFAIIPRFYREVSDELIIWHYDVYVLVEANDDGTIYDVVDKYIIANL